MMLAVVVLDVEVSMSLEGGAHTCQYSQLNKYTPAQAPQPMITQINEIQPQYMHTGYLPTKTRN